MSIRTLRRHVDLALSARIRRSLAHHGYGEAFNPSPRVHEGQLALTIRARRHGASGGFHGLILRERGDDFDLIDLTEHLAALGIAPVADPKLCVLGDALFVTFNSGHRSDSDNAVHLMRVTPELGPPQRCDLEGGRQRVEKNWTFAVHSGGLVALYDLATLTTLRLVAGRLDDATPLRFARAHVGLVDPSRSLAIGTQLADVGDASLLIAHEKHSFAGKRLYAGRLVRLADLWSDSPSATVSPRRLIHSVRAAMPHRPAHNPNLLSATYFAGLSADADGLTVGYGINDVGFAVARIREGDLW